MRRLFVVGPGNRAVQRTVVADRTQGQDWVVTQGLAPGEKVITQGLGNLRDGARDQARAGERAADGPGAAAGGNEKWRGPAARRLTLTHVAHFH